MPEKVSALLNEKVHKLPNLLHNKLISVSGRHSAISRNVAQQFYEIKREEIEPKKMVYLRTVYNKLKKKNIFRNLASSPIYVLQGKQKRF